MFKLEPGDLRNMFFNSHGHVDWTVFDRIRKGERQLSLFASEVDDAVQDYHMLIERLVKLPAIPQNASIYSMAAWPHGPNQLRTFAITDKGELAVACYNARLKGDEIVGRVEAPLFQGSLRMHMRRFLESGGCSEDIEDLVRYSVEQFATPSTMKISSLPEDAEDAEIHIFPNDNSNDGMETKVSQKDLESIFGADAAEGAEMKCWTWKRDGKLFLALEDITDGMCEFDIDGVDAEK